MHLTPRAHTIYLRSQTQCSSGTQHLAPHPQKSKTKKIFLLVYLEWFPQSYWENNQGEQPLPQGFDVAGLKHPEDMRAQEAQRVLGPGVTC